MQPFRLQEWFAFGVFASWTSAQLLSIPSTGRWAGEDSLRLMPLISFLFAVTATAPLYLRLLLSGGRAGRGHFLVPLFSGLLHAPVILGLMWLAETTIPPATLDALAAVVMIGWTVLLAEVAYRAGRAG